MSIDDFVPWNWTRKRVPVRREDGPVSQLQRQFNKKFEEFLNSVGLEEHFSSFMEKRNSFVPRVDVRDTQKEIIVTAELPGIEENDVDVSLDDESLIIKGEKRNDFEEQEGDRLYVERSYGSFQRIVPLVSDIDRDGIKATFRKGILTVVLPKTDSETRQSRKITINSPQEL